MYTEYFGLTEEPFNVTPDPKFLFPSAKHQDALTRIGHGVSKRKGIMALIGEAGTGKTTLIRTLLKGLNGNTVSAWVFNTTLQDEDLICYICKDFGIKVKKNDKSELFMELNRFLMDVYSKGKNAILVVDEAQNVNPYWLEQIRQLTNLETSTQKLLQVILSGQPKLEEHLANPGLKQLNQRISVRSRLSRLNKNETMQYIKHRLNVVNGDSEKIFETEALESVYEVSKGIPRLINVVCDNALMRGQKEKVSKIRAEIVLSLLKEGLITTADRQNESALTRIKSTMMTPKVSRITLKPKSNGSNGNGKLAKMMEFGNEFAGVDMGVLAIA